MTLWRVLRCARLIIEALGTDGLELVIAHKDNADINLNTIKSVLKNLGEESMKRLMIGSEFQKGEVLSFVDSYNKLNGGNGLEQATKLYDYDRLTIRKWMASEGVEDLQPKDGQLVCFQDWLPRLNLKFLKPNATFSKESLKMINNEKLPDLYIKFMCAEGLFPWVDRLFKYGPWNRSGMVYRTILS